MATLTVQPIQDGPTHIQDLASPAQVLQNLGTTDLYLSATPFTTTDQATITLSPGRKLNLTGAHDLWAATATTPTTIGLTVGIFAPQPDYQPQPDNPPEPGEPGEPCEPGEPGEPGESVPQGPDAEIFQFTIRLTEPGEYALPLNNGRLRVTIDWGDGTDPTTINQDSGRPFTQQGGTWTWTGPGLHVYTAAGDYQITLTPSTPHAAAWCNGFGGVLSAPAATSKEKIISIDTPLPARMIPGSYGSWMRGATQLKSLPAGLFDNCPQAQSLVNCFDGCAALETVPDGLFDSFALGSSFNYCFRGCATLEAVPEGLFDNCPVANSVSSCFSGCVALKAVPNGLFDNCAGIRSFDFCFSGCAALETVPEDLFDNSTAATTFASCFAGCDHLTINIDNLASSWDLSKVVTLKNCFGQCSQITGHGQTLIDKPKAAAFGETASSGCFADCTSLADYADLPSAWK